jgi:hypothetical protein
MNHSDLTRSINALLQLAMTLIDFRATSDLAQATADQAERANFLAELSYHSKKGDSLGELELYNLTCALSHSCQEAADQALKKTISAEIDYLAAKKLYDEQQRGVLEGLNPSYAMAGDS